MVHLSELFNNRHADSNQCLHALVYTVMLWVWSRLTTTHRKPHTMTNLASYVSESRFNFAGGYCTAYLMHREGTAPGYFIHTITRMDGGLHFKSEPFKVALEVSVSIMRQMASLIPMS